MLKKFICLLLGIIMVFTVAACKESGTGNTGNNNGGDNTQTGGNNTVVVPDNPSHDENTNIQETIKETDTLLIDNGTTDYKIVIPATNPGLSVRYGASEIKYFIKDANGCEIEVITDEGLTFNESDKYISIGNTTLADGSGLTVTEDEVGWDGFKIKTYGNTVIILSPTDNGHLNGAYGWLQRNLKYHYYADDEWTIDNSSTIKLLDVEVQEKPTFYGRYVDFQGRSVAEGSGDYDKTRWYTRMRITDGQGGAVPGRTSNWANNNDQSMESQIWSGSYAVNITQKHTQSGKLVPWTTDDGSLDQGQICLSTLLDGLDDGDVDLMGKNEAFTSFAVEFINRSFSTETDNRIFFLGINDNTNKCNCAECTAYYSAIKESGIMLKFTNELNRVMKRWLNNEFNGKQFDFGANFSKQRTYQLVDSPDGDEDRVYMIGFFSYLYTIEPPAYWDENKQAYVPLDDVKTVYNSSTEKFTTQSIGIPMVADDEVMIRIAPIQSVNMFPHMDKDKNPAAYLAFSGWGVCTQHLTVWDYGTNFNAYLAPYPDWSTLQENFLMYEEKGVLDVFTQLAAHTDGVAFNRMMVYLRSQLMYNVHQNVEELIVNFMNNYYKEAGPIVYEYFCWIRSEYETMKLVGGSAIVNSGEQGYNGHIYGKVPYSETTWSHNEVIQMRTFFDRAFAAIEKMKTTDPEGYAKAEYRLKTESLFYRYLLLKNYASFYPATISNMIDEFEFDANRANLTSVGRLVGQAQGGTTDLLDNVIAGFRTALL